jgi:hypothetical protein
VFQQLVNNRLRGAIRKGIRTASPTDWNAPFNMTASISGTTLDNHLRTLQREVDDGIAKGTARHEADLESLVAHLRSQGVMPVLVSSPTHPQLREGFGPTGDRLRTLAQGWSQKYGGIYADATALLDETGFADGQHLNEKGRGLLSAFIAGVLPPPGAT